MTAVDTVPATVVWWKTSLALAEIPRRHIIEWCDTNGSPHGTVTITSPHLRLDRRTIEMAVAENVAGRYPVPPRLGTADQWTRELTAEARLRASGHQVLIRDLTRVYGEPVVGGIVATLLGRGVEAYVLVDRGATPAVGTAVCQAAENALAHFSGASPRELYDRGWERGQEDRWQLLLQRR